MVTKCIAFLGVGLVGVSLTVGAEEPPVPKTPQEKDSYASGVYVVRNFRHQGADINLDLLIRGMKDAFAGGPLLMTEKDIRATMRAFQLELRKTQVQITRVATVENRVKGDKFLAENKSKEGVVVLPSGLQYKILKAGTGNKPTGTDTVEYRFRGTLLDGTEFDSSDPGGGPATLKIADPTTILGLREALKLMPVGSKWQLFVPPQFAYGARGVGLDIGPNETVLFEVELVGIKAVAAEPAAPAVAPAPH